MEMLCLGLAEPFPVNVWNWFLASKARVNLYQSFGLKPEMKNGQHISQDSD
jgi:hypothetical protein